ncbi:MAG: hypothetical protein HN366_18430 [Deltaproteobacteria bacterium]|nr:hypothetical protein [Deltaproteobacteria bacterium]MBT6499740.1 hypothetical protein [Deltaproteobacteria bacterium]
MDEGVDPTDMCQSMIDRVARSKQLTSISEPEILSLFEDWLEELDGEIVAFVKETGSKNPFDLAKGCGLSRSGAKFLITKLKREGKL